MTAKPTCTRWPTRGPTIATLIGLAGGLGCSRGEVKTQPDPAWRAALAWHGESKVNQAADRLVWSGMFWLGQWDLGDPVTVVEGDSAVEYRGLVLEVQFDDVTRSQPCRPDGAYELYLWRPNADSSGIEAIFYHGPHPATTDDASFGRRRQCPRGPRSDSHLGRFPYLPTKRDSAGPGAHGPSATASAGQAHVTTLDPGRPGNPCRLVGGALYHEPCEERRYAITIHAVLGTEPSSARLAIGPVVVRGLRFSRPCKTGALNESCADSAQAAFDELWLAQGKAGRIPPQWRDAAAYLSRWDDEPVLRTVVVVRFREAMSDRDIAAALSQWGATIEIWSGAGTLVIRTPDPGGDPAAFERALGRLRATAGVEDVWPIRAGSEPRILAPEGRVVATLRDQAGRPLSNGGVCPTGPVAAWGPWCRRADGSGKVTFDSMAPLDYRLEVGCEPTGSERWAPYDSTVVRVAPGRAVEARFRPAPAACPSRGPAR
ncbi:MAG: hypothetical protein R2909_02980 [Gemmatimonadales bacterium]